MNVNAAILKALQQLGYKNPKPIITQISINRHSVEMGGEYFGIWDALKNTFVD
ncbi:MAG: hypothetical protein RSB39_07230 [Oscillospiraceae bacterium]